MEDVVVIGGGVAGIAAAAALAARGRVPTILESSAMLGGKAASLEVAGRIVERGPQSLNTRGEALLSLFSSLGVALVPSGRRATGRYLVRRARLRALPRALTAREAWAVLKEAVRTRAAPRAGELPLEELFRARFGASFTEHVLGAAIAGIYAGDIATLGSDACFPALSHWLEAHGSIVRGALAARRGAQEGRRILVARDGMGALGRAAQARFRTITGCRIEAIEARAGGVRVISHRTYDARAVVLATPAAEASRLLGSLAPEAAAQLARVRYEPIAVISWRSSRTRLPRGFGYLAAPSEGLRCLGTVFVSDVRGEEGRVRRFATFAGGARDRVAANENDESLVRRLEQDLWRLGAGELDEVEHIERWPLAIAQPEVGHRGRMADARRALAHLPVTLAGAYLGAGTLRDAAESGREAAAACP